ncbi:cache domain-containing protein [Amphritea pacifica]|uniref:Cache domain-containing protein n=1 Tax=Amphritea pacifica TaxID=2811233 RepID=A0ABS2W2C2_9GAMM|nr:cache domain-containing protein [Amphritea pacifica]MBN0985854.1 cache domain-containing protein [Amphritea pacifica]MBN1005935.1 cache domain-containing protein [Amphritea pacifica]
MYSIRKLARLALTVTVTTILSTTTAIADEGAATPDEVVTKVWGAAKVLQTKGASAIPSLNNADGPWVWKDSYVFAFDCRLDRMVAHPMRPDLVGRPIMQVTDNNGKRIFKELCDAAKHKNGGWVDYQWTKPGAGQTSRKLSYAVTADLAFSTGIQVAAGVYDETLSVEQLNKMTEQLADPGSFDH